MIQLLASGSTSVHQMAGFRWKCESDVGPDEQTLRFVPVEDLFNVNTLIGRAWSFAYVYLPFSHNE
jgi:hypothetical protein